MDARSEQQPTPQNLEIQLKQKFHPFNDENTKPIIVPSLKGAQVQAFRNTHPHTLLIDDMRIPINFATHATRGDRRNIMTPFNLTDGYQIDNVDFDLEARIKKVDSPEYKRPIDFDKNPLSISIERYLSFTIQDGLAIKDGHATVLKPEVAEALRGLKIILYFPNGSAYVAGMDPLTQTLGGIAFNYFHPIDSRPLATSRNHQLHEGLFLYVPSDFGKLKQIKAQFIKQDHDDQEPYELPMPTRPPKPPASQFYGDPKKDK